MPESELQIYLTNPDIVADSDDYFYAESACLPRRIPLPLVRGHNRAERVVTYLREFQGRAEFDIEPFPPDKYLEQEELIARQANAAESGAYGRDIQALAREATHCAALVMDDPANLAPLADIDRQAEHTVQDPPDAGQPTPEGEGEKGAGVGTSQTDIQLPASQLPQVSDESAAGETMSTEARALGSLADRHRGGDDAWLTHGDIAERFGFDREPLRKRLERYRAKHHDCYPEVADSDRKPRESRYLYRLSSVEPLIAQLKKASDETSGDRPAKKT